MLIVILLLAAILITLLSAWHPVGIILGIILGIVAWVGIAALISEALGGGEGTTAVIALVLPGVTLLVGAIWLTARGDIDIWGNPRKHP